MDVLSYILHQWIYLILLPDSEWSVWVLLAWIVNTIVATCFVVYLEYWVCFQMDWRKPFNFENPYKSYMNWIRMDFKSKGDNRKR